MKHTTDDLRSLAEKVASVAGASQPTVDDTKAQCILAIAASAAADELDRLRAEVASLRREDRPMPVVLPGAAPVLPLVQRTLAEMLTPRHPQMGNILALLDERTAEGIKSYKIALMAPNGRDFLKDATEEAADLVQYLAGLRHLRDYDPRRLRLLHALVSVAYNQMTLALAEAEMEFHP
jgi:hypothetical protein